MRSKPEVSCTIVNVTPGLLGATAALTGAHLFPSPRSSKRRGGSINR